MVRGAPPAATVEEDARVAGRRRQTAADFKAEVEQLVRGEAAEESKEEPAVSGARQASVDDFKAEVGGSID